MKTKQNNKRVHRAVRNIMFNELGVSPPNVRGMIVDVVNDRITAEIAKHGGFDDTVRKIVREHIDQMAKTNKWHTPDVIANIVAKEAERVIGTAVKNALIRILSGEDNV